MWLSARKQYNKDFVAEHLSCFSLLINTWQMSYPSILSLSTCRQQLVYHDMYIQDSIPVYIAALVSKNVLGSNHFPFTSQNIATSIYDTVVLFTHFRFA